MRRAPLVPEDMISCPNGGEMAGCFSPGSTPIIEVRSEKLGGHLSTALFLNRLVCHDCPPFSSKKFRLNFSFSSSSSPAPIPYHHWREIFLRPSDHLAVLRMSTLFTLRLFR